MSSIVGSAGRSGAWRAILCGVGGYVLGSVIGVLIGLAGYEPMTGNIAAPTLAVIGPVGGLVGTTLAARRHHARHLTSRELALFWCAVTVAVVICGYVYLRVDQASAVTGLIAGATALQVMRIGLLDRSANSSSVPVDIDRTVTT